MLCRAASAGVILMRFPAALAVVFLVFTWHQAAPPADAAGLPVPAQALVPLAAHHALYKLTLHSDPDGNVVAASGTMGYQVIDACDAWAVRQRLDMTVTNTDGQNIHMISDYATWESKDGRRMRFHMRQITDGATTMQTDGNATLEGHGGPGVVHYTMPRVATVKLPAGTLFPMAHTAAIIAAARAGKKFIALPLFDGTDDNGAEDSAIAIADWKPPFPTRWPPLSALPSTRVQLAFFDRKPATMLPDYQAGMRYWENGVADNMTMDFGDFVMDAKMTEFALQPHNCAER
jgi:hypothetical protein